MSDTMKGSLQRAFGFDGDRPLTVVYNPANLDSFLSAFLLWLHKGKTGDGTVTFYATVKGSVPSDISNKQLLCLGFSYRKNTLMALLKMIHKIRIIDGYILDDPEPQDHQGYDFYPTDSASNRLKKIKVIDTSILDVLNRSSSCVVWTILYPKQDLHPIVRYVQDRELFAFKLKNTREVIAALTSYPMDFGSWFEVFNSPIETLVSDGTVIRRYHNEAIKYTVKSATRMDALGFFDVLTVNCPWFMMSEVLAVLAQNEPFVVGYYDKQGKRHVSLRSSSKAQVDVLTIAKQFGGGGHCNAAGFTVDLNSMPLFGSKHFKQSQ